MVIRVLGVHLRQKRRGDPPPALPAITAIAAISGRNEVARVAEKIEVNTFRKGMLNEHRRTNGKT